MAAKFSERIGKRAPKVAIQTDTMDAELRNGLWNVVDNYIATPFGSDYSVSGSRFKSFFQVLYSSFYKEPIDSMHHYISAEVDDLRERFFSWDAYDVYDFLDFAVNSSALPVNIYDFTETLNFILTRELSAYRFVKGELAPITSEYEIKAIEEAVNSTGNSRYKGASIHLSSALEKLSDRHEPDYRNSIKESISAVESVCQVIAGTPNATLGAALKVIEKSIPLHGALKQGLLSIYGYTSDGDGIRHALLEESNLKQEDALFMLVSCSAFVNYLTAKASKIAPSI